MLGEFQRALCGGAAVADGDGFEELEQIQTIAFGELGSHSDIEEHNVWPRFEDVLPRSLGLRYSNENIPRMHIRMDEVVHLKKKN